MADTDRTQWKKVMVGELGSSRTVANAASAVAQDTQRYLNQCVGPTATTAGSNFLWQFARTDRPVKVIEVRVLPGAALIANATNYVSLTYGYTNDNGGALTVMGTSNTTPVANGGTGNWASAQSFVVAPNTAVNAVIPAGSNVQFNSTAVGTGVAIPVYTAFQMIWEEV